MGVKIGKEWLSGVSDYDFNGLSKMFRISQGKEERIRQILSNHNDILNQYHLLSDEQVQEKTFNAKSVEEFCAYVVDSCDDKIFLNLVNFLVRNNRHGKARRSSREYIQRVSSLMEELLEINKINSDNKKAA